MAPPPSLSAPWNTANAFGRELDGLMNSNPPYSAGYHERHPSPEGTFPQIQLPSMNPNNSEPSPLARWTSTPGPWNPQQVAGRLNQSPAEMASPRSYSNNVPQTPIFAYTGGSPSSSATGLPHVDSGYGSRTVWSTNDRSQGCSSDAGEYSNMATYDSQPYTGAGGSTYHPEEDYYTPMEIISPDHAPNKCEYENCTFVAKNQSEHKLVPIQRVSDS